MADPNETALNESNPWRTGVLATGGILIVLAAAIAIAGAIDGGESDDEAATAQPSQAVVEDCNRYAAEASRDTERVVKNGVVGGAIGAGLGAASGAIADGGEGAGKGAGIGALAGAAAGTLYGLNEENRRTDAARAAYRECMARQGY